MALNLKEQLDLINDILKPTVIGKETLLEDTYASGLNFARDFNTGYKLFETVDNTDPNNPIIINSLATAYLNKMLAATAKMIIADDAGLASLRSVMASLISKVDVVDVAFITNASTSLWYGFINDHIQEALELFAGVRIEEKAAYDALV